MAKRIQNQLIKCRNNRFVYQFVKEIQDTDYLFEGLELNPDVYWLYLECDDEAIPDIICSWYWSMKTVKHLLEWIRSFKRSEMVKLVLKQRIYSIRYLTSIERSPDYKVYCIFYEVRRSYLIKNNFYKFVKLDKIIEISCILGLIEAMQNESSTLGTEIKNVRLQRTVPEGCLFQLSESEWIRRSDLFLQKNSYLKNQPVITLVKKFLSYLSNSPCYCASIHQYKLHKVEESQKKKKEKSEVKEDGTLAINIYGIFFFEKGTFELATAHYKLHQIRHMEITQEYVYFEFLIDTESKQNFFVTRISSTNMEDVVFDLVAYMQIAMREPKKMYYAYNFLSNVYFPKFKRTF